jgi:hypothetical protein
VSRLALVGRPWVAFDAANKRHRKWYTEFQRKGTWGHCPVRFLIDDEAQGNLVTMIQRRLVEYYITREFAT